MIWPSVHTQPADFSPLAFQKTLNTLKILALLFSMRAGPFQNRCCEAVNLQLDTLEQKQNKRKGEKKKEKEKTHMRHDADQKLMVLLYFINITPLPALVLILELYVLTLNGDHWCDAYSSNIKKDKSSDTDFGKYNFKTHILTYLLQFKDFFKYIIL